MAEALLLDESAAQRQSRQELVEQWVVRTRIGALVLGLSFTLLLAARYGRPVSGRLPWLILAAIAITVVRSKRPPKRTSEQVFDTFWVTAILALGGGMEGAFALFGAATAFSIGVAAGVPGGIVAATVLVFGGTILGLDAPTRAPELDTVIGWVSLYPVGAVLGGLVGHVLVDGRSGQALLVEANRVLASLERLAVAAPETLSPARVAAAAAAQFRMALDAELALIMFEREGTLLELGRDGTFDAGPHLVLDREWQDLVRTAGPMRVDETTIPARLTRQLPALPRWVAIPLRSRDSSIGVALVGGSRSIEGRALRATLLELAAETAVALDNTQLFARVEHAAAAAERERLARDLHDGVAQQLTHVRFELELLARSVDTGATRSELDRLARVAARATDDVRSAIRGLRAQALDEGLVPALRSLVADLDGAAGPTLELDVLGAAELDPDTTAELYRIMQEALSNALRHAKAEHIRLSMDVIDSTLVLVVEDDGVGLGGGGSDDGDGMGLRTMRSRARRIGAGFSLDDADEGGARMQLRLPLTQEST